MALCFPCFKVKVLKVFRVVTVARERIRLVPLKAMPTSRPTPLENAAIKIPPVITADVIRSVSTMPVIVLNHLFFFFLAIRSRTSISSSKYASTSANFLSDMFMVLVVAVGFTSGSILPVVSLSHMLILYLIFGDTMSSG